MRGLFNLALRAIFPGQGASSIVCRVNGDFQCKRFPFLRVNLLLCNSVNSLKSPLKMDISFIFFSANTFFPFKYLKERKNDS